MPKYITNAGGESAKQKAEMERPEYVPDIEDEDGYEGRVNEYYRHVNSLLYFPLSASLKQELINKYGEEKVMVGGLEIDAVTDTCKCLIGQDCPLMPGRWISPCTLLYPSPKPAQRVFTEREMIGFAEWIEENNIQYKIKVEQEATWYWPDEDKLYQTSGLLQQYIQSTK